MNTGRQTLGFTLVELLIVVVIVGILAAIAIPKFSNSKEKSYIASMKSDLRNVATAQESYLYDNSTYTPNVADLAFTSTSNVTIVINTGTVSGWSASASHPQTGSDCYLFVGSAAPVGAATQEGQIACS